MGVLTRFISKARALFNDKQQSNRVPSFAKPPLGGTGYYGQSYRWEQVLHYKYWAFIAIKARMNEIAGGEPLQLGDVDAKPSRTKRIRKVLGGPQEHEGFTPYDHDHPISRVFRNPNGPDVAYDLWAYHTLFKSLTGIVYWWVMRNKFGMPVEIWVVPSHWARLVVGNDGYPSHFVIQSPWGHTQDVPYEDIVTFVDHSPLSRYEGLAVSTAVGEWIDVYESLTRMRLAVFKNGAMPATHIMLGESYADPDEAYLTRFYAKWLARFEGENNSGRPLLTGADIEVKGVEGHRPADALVASNDSEEHIRDMVLAAYGVPKGVVGLEPISDTSAYAPQRQFCRFTINPELAYTGQVITEKVVKRTPGCERGVAYWNDRVANNVELEEQRLKDDLASGLITYEEARSLRGREADPKGGRNPIIGGQEMPWVATTQDDSEFASEFTEQTSAASSGGGAGNELRSSVGGATALLELQKSFYAHEVPREAAMATAKLLYGFSAEECATLFPEPQPGEVTTQTEIKRNGKVLSGTNGSGGGYSERP